MAHCPTDWFGDVITQTWRSGHDMDVSCTQGIVGQGRGPKMGNRVRTDQSPGSIIKLGQL